MKSMTTLAAFLVLAASASTAAHAQAKPDVLVKQRQAAMTLQAKYLGPIGAMVKGAAPWDAAVVARNAAYLEVLTKMAWDGFDPSTANEKTRAKPEIYKEMDKFKALADTLQADTAKLAAAAKAGDQGAAKAAFGAVGKTCGTCHDTYRTQ